MKTAYCPQNHVKLGDARVGVAYGHVPGHTYRDVDVVISVRSDRYRVHVCESWGSWQGYDEEHGRREIVARGEGIESTCCEAFCRAVKANINQEYLQQAISLAEDEAEEEVAV